MLNLKTPRSHRFWKNVSDEKLAALELTTDNPESLDGIVYELPTGEEEPHVEYAYDLRGSEREKIRCLQCGQPHLAGFVMRLGDARFLIGHICGKNIYGENFDVYTADYQAAVNRQDAVRRVRELQAPLNEFMAWMATLNGANVFKHFAKVQRQFREHMPFVAENLPRLAHRAADEKGLTIPPKLFAETTDPEADYLRIATELNGLQNTLAGDPEKAAAELIKLKPRTDSVLVRIERMLDELQTMVDFFQPAVLSYVAGEATDLDHPKKRSYSAGPELLALTMKNQKGEKLTLRLPSGYAVPDRGPIAKLRAALKNA